MLPNFVVIGAQKAGTTSLWLYLGQHPSIFMSPVKEPNFFIADRGWHRGTGWYESLFEPAGDDAIAIGEVSPNYTWFPVLAGVPERMAKVLPSARLIYILREPVERIRSSYLHDLAHGSETRPLAEALFDRPHYLAASRYATQIERYLEHFERSQLLLLLAEDLQRDPGAVLDRILAFLDLEPGWRPPNLGVRHHETAAKRVPRRWWRGLGGLMIRGRIPEIPVPPTLTRSRLTTRALRPTDVALSADTRRRIEDLLRPDVESLRAYLGPEFDGWGWLR